MKNSEFTRLMTEASYNSQEAQSKIAAAVDRVFDELPGEFNALSVDTNLFEELAEAERAGNVDRVRELKRKAGARGLRAIMEAAMLDIMYEVPYLEGISACRITEGVITKGEPPQLTFEKKQSA